MYQIDFSSPISIHFIGIGGISMSGLAEFMHSKGFPVTGSDIKPTEITKHLQAKGIAVSYPQKADNIPSDCTLVIYTVAVHESNPEMIAAKERKLPILERKDLLGQIMKQFTHVVGVSGTHGKTTTTSMLSFMLMEGGLDPTVLVGGLLDGIGGNIKLGSDQYLVAEACEYYDSFLSFFPTDAIILNIEAEHLDYFKTLENVRKSFREYAALLPKDGTLAIHGDIKNLSEIVNGVSCRVVTFGICDDEKTISRYDYSATGLTFDRNGFGQFDLYEYGKFLFHFSLHIVGAHNVANSLSAIAIARSHGVTCPAIQTALTKYTGTHRRFEFRGNVNGVRVYDDYGHHPQEITATLRAARVCVTPEESLWCVFQPHTFSRTKAFLHEFVDALSLADKVIMADIYSAARETDPGDISSGDIARLLKEKGKEVYYFHSFLEIEKFLRASCQPDDLLITMGAGDIVSVADSLTKA